MATEKQTRAEGKSSGSRAAPAASGDLKSREYRDSGGGVHHHTRKYVEEHGTSGSAAKSRAKAQPSEAAPGAAEEDEAEEDESGVLQTQVEMLAAMAQMDAEAAAAYEKAAELIGSSDLAKPLREFAADHRRHVVDIERVVQRLGAQPIAAAPSPESSVFAQLTSAVSMNGPEAAVLALLGNEQFTNAAYEMALDLVDDDDTQTLLERNFADEQRHIAWLSERSEEMAAEEDEDDDEA
jgi:rubrerythrin